MPTTTRLQVLNAIKARLAVITVANGYATDAGQLIALGEVTELGDDDPDAALAIVVGDDAPKPQSTVGTTLAEWPLRIAALAKADLAEPWTTVEQVLGDIKRAFELSDRTLGGLLKGDIQRGSTRVIPRDPGSTTIGVAITYVGIVSERWGQP